jgi:hypothetical protein
MSNFPKKNFLVYKPNNFQVWYNALVEHASHEYGVLATVTGKSNGTTIKVMLFREGSVVGRHGISSGCLLTFNT